MPTQITLEMPTDAAGLIAADPERFKAYALENGFDITSVEVRQPSTRTEFGSARTACSCADCSINCRFIPGYLIPADLERIAAHVGAENVMAFAADNLLASPGAIVMDSHTGKQHRIPTLVPARRPDGACKFLGTNGDCSIHAVSPFGCAFFDSHQRPEESDSLSMRGLMEVDDAWNTTGSMYSLLWLLLNEAGLTAPAPMIARAQMKAAMAVAANR